MPKRSEAWAEFRKLAQLDAILYSFQSILFDLGAIAFAQQIAAMRKQNVVQMAQLQNRAYAAHARSRKAKRRDGVEPSM